MWDFTTCLHAGSDAHFYSWCRLSRLKHCKKTAVTAKAPAGVDYTRSAATSLCGRVNEVPVVLEPCKSSGFNEAATVVLDGPDISPRIFGTIDV